MLIEQVNNILYIFAILGFIFIIVAILALLFWGKNNKIINFITRNSIPLAFLISLMATLGSLFYSETAGFAPCDLCWFQRIFMYPQVILLGLAWWKKEDIIINYSLILILIGTLFSVYHNYIYYTAQPTGFCSIVSPCTQTYILGFGFITIPLMAITAFVLMGLLLLNKKFRN